MQTDITFIATGVHGSVRQTPPFLILGRKTLLSSLVPNSHSGKIPCREPPLSGRLSGGGLDSQFWVPRVSHIDGRGVTPSPAAGHAKCEATKENVSSSRLPLMIKRAGFQFFCTPAASFPLSLQRPLRILSRLHAPQLRASASQQQVIVK